VSTARNLFDLIALTAILRFSLKILVLNIIYITPYSRE